MSIRFAVVRGPDAIAPLPPSAVGSPNGDLQILGAPDTPLLVSAGMILIGWAFDRDRLTPLELLDDVVEQDQEEGHPLGLPEYLGQFLSCLARP